MSWIYKEMIDIFNVNKHPNVWQFSKWRWPSAHAHIMHIVAIPKNTNCRFLGHDCKTLEIFKTICDELQDHTKSIYKVVHYENKRKHEKLMRKDSLISKNHCLIVHANYIVCDHFCHVRPMG